MNFLYKPLLAPFMYFERSSRISPWSLVLVLPLDLLFPLFVVPVDQEQQVESQRVHHQMEEELSRVKQVSHTCRRSTEGWGRASWIRATGPVFFVLWSWKRFFSFISHSLVGKETSSRSQKTQIQLPWFNLCDLKMAWMDENLYRCIEGFVVQTENNISKLPWAESTWWSASQPVRCNLPRELWPALVVVARFFVDLNSSSCKTKMLDFVHCKNATIIPNKPGSVAGYGFFLPTCEPTKALANGQRTRVKTHKP